MANINLYKEIVHADFASGRRIVTGPGSMGGLIISSPKKYKRMTARRQWYERGFYWFNVIFFGLGTGLVCLGVSYDPGWFWNSLKSAGIGVTLIASILTLFVVYQFAIGQGYLRWMYKHKKTDA